jgi:hypothetical protein
MTVLQVQSLPVLANQHRQTSFSRFFFAISLAKRGSAKSWGFVSGQPRQLDKTTLKALERSEDILHRRWPSPHFSDTARHRTKARQVYDAAAMRRRLCVCGRYFALLIASQRQRVRNL